MKILALTSLMLIGALSLRAQQTEPAYGIFLDYDLNQHAANFQQLPGVPNCCPQFANGSGTGVAFGGAYRAPLAHPLIFTIRAGLLTQNATLDATEATTVYSPSGPAAGEFDHHLEAKLTVVGVEPMIGLDLGGSTFHIGAGLRLGALVSAQYSQKEELTKPSGSGTFLDSTGKDSHKRTRNELTGTIPSAGTFQGAAVVGASVSLPLNATRTVLIEPQVQYSLGLTPIASGLSWRANAIQLGIALWFTARRGGVY
jgi:hypothetical protein